MKGLVSQRLSHWRLISDLKHALCPQIVLWYVPRRVLFLDSGWSQNEEIARAAEVEMHP